MRHVRVVALLAVVAVVLARCSHPRSGVEPLPDGLRAVAEHEPPPLPIEGKQLCMVIAADDGADIDTVLERLETHLTETKDWKHHPSGQIHDWAPLNLLQHGRGLLVGTGSDYLPSPAMSRARDACPSSRYCAQELTP